jgi:hypothetical protein
VLNGLRHIYVVGGDVGNVVVSVSGGEGAVAEIKHQQSSASSGISLMEIHIPDDGDAGTGTFTVTLRPVSVPPDKMIPAIVTRHPIFEISVNLFPEGDLSVLLGKFDGSEPMEVAAFALPNKPKAVHTVKVTFNQWHVLGVLLDGLPLMRKFPLTH